MMLLYGRDRRKIKRKQNERPGQAQRLGTEKEIKKPRDESRETR